ncbi:DNA methyltransferase, partial [Deinococcus cellulosilyticus]
MTEPLLTAHTPEAGPQKSTNETKFVSLLHDQILKLDQAELDFGLYRILNRRRTDITDYLKKRLPAILQKSVGGAAEKQIRELETQLTDLQQKLNAAAAGMGYDEGAFVEGKVLPALETVPNAQKYQQLSAQLDMLKAQQALSGTEMDQLYLHLLTFFGRYYQGGDFLTVPRRGRSRFFAPYGGQDTLFHWRSRGSHYVKTSTELRTYAYTPQNPPPGGPRTIRFELIEADTEQNNVKGSRRYFFPHPQQISLQGDVLTLPFSFRPFTAEEEANYKTRSKKNEDEDDTEENSGSIQDQLLQEHLKSKALPEAASKVDAEELYRQARRYARKNTSDYFVHPNLGPFLKAELDQYLLREYLRPESLQSPETLQDRFVKYRALKEAAEGLIDFLHQLEDFQAQLFEKRKFVYAADYLMPVRLVPEHLWPDLLSSHPQLEAWRDLFHLDLTAKSPEDRTQALKEHPTLVVDTRHHAPQIKHQLLASFDNIEANLDGVLVHGENYGALRSLEPTYRERVKLIYIDPPYNTGGDGFLYKDEYSKHSTWLSMIHERVSISKNFLSMDGVLFASIDDDEQSRLTEVLREDFGDENLVANIIWQKKYSPANDARFFSDDHDFIQVFAKDINAWRPQKLARTDDQNKLYQNPDNDPAGPWMSGDS